MGHDTLLAHLDHELETIGTPEGQLFARALRIIAGNVDELRVRLRAVELAVDALADRVPKPSRPRAKSIFGLKVEVKPDVTDDQIRSAVDELGKTPLGTEEILEALERRGLVRRLPDRPNPSGPTK